MTFSLIGGHTAEEAVRRMLQSGLTNNLARHFNWAGKGFKEAFKNTALSDVLFGMFVKTQSHHTSIRHRYHRFFSFFSANIFYGVGF